VPNVLVTGATGFIGKALCRRILAEGWNVRGAIRSSTKKAILPQGVDGVEIGTIDSETKWEPALDDIDAVVHLAARAHVMDESSADPIIEYRKINVDGTKHLAQIAESKKVRRFVFVSSIKVNGEGRPDPYTEEDSPSPVGPYAISKFEAEKELHCVAGNTRLEVVILRPPLVYGPEVKANFLKLINIVDRGIPLPLARVKNRRSMIYLKNLVDAIFLCTIHPEAAGKTFLLSDGKDVSTPELIQKISFALGKPSLLFPVPLNVLRLLAKVTGRSKIADRLIDSLIVDTSKIRSQLGWEPPFSVEEGLKETAKWYVQVSRINKR
jgi:nucleoside-diphosphate-sugar epimerase